MTDDADLRFSPPPPKTGMRLRVFTRPGPNGEVTTDSIITDEPRPPKRDDEKQPS